MKHNKKTVTVITESGHKWNVSPHLLRKVKKAKGQRATSGKIIDLKKTK